MVDKQEGAGEYEFAPPAPAAPREVTGAPVPPPEKPPEAPAAAGPAAAEKPAQVLPERICPHCGFRIVGKPLRGRCPECAAMVDEQTSDRLQFSDGRWLVAASNGTLLAALAIVAHAAAVVAGLNWSKSAMTATAPGTMPTVQGPWLQGAILHAVAGTLGALGIWLATRREPGASRRSGWAGWARWTALGVAILWLAPLLKKGQAVPVQGRDVLALAVLLAMAAEGMFVSLYLRVLAGRVPNDSLVAQFLNLAFGVPAICLVLVVLQLAGQADLRNMDQKFLCGFSILGGLTVAVLWTVITLLRMAVELRNCAAAGQAIETRKALKAQAQEKE